MLKKIYECGLVTFLAGIFLTGSVACAQNVSSAMPTAGFTFAQNLSLGARGNDVTALQQFLIAGRYLKLSTSTGYFGPLTAKALATWQASVGISPSAGYFGPLSRVKINELAQSAPMNVTSTQSAIAIATIMAGTTSLPVAGGTIGLPIRLIIPTLDVDTNFQDTGLKSDGTMEVPSTIYVVGWFTGSVRPGEKGVAIITGHVAQIRGGVVTKMGVFSNLYEIRVGDELQVIDDQGQTIDFVVRAVRSYDPTADATDVFTSTDGGVHLNLITCEGTWVPSQVSYTERLVVFADLSASSTNHAAQ